MKNYGKIFHLLMLFLTSCATLNTKQSSVTLIPLLTTSPNMTATATDLPSKPVLQLTYSNSSADAIGELYVLDIICMSNDKLCFGKPHLVLKTPERTPNTSDTNMPGSISSYAWSPDGKKIALCALGVGGHNDIFFVDNTSDPLKWINLTNSNIEECDPKWDTSGNNIFYLGCSFDEYQGCRLFSSNIAENKKKMWVENSNLDFYDLSFDNKKVVFTKKTSNSQIYISDINGSNLQQSTVGDWDDLDPSFSPDGESIAFARWHMQQTINDVDQADIIIKNLLTGVEKNITEEIDSLAVDPVFSPDGKWVAFNVFKSGVKGSNIFVYSLEKSITIQATSGNASYMNSSWRWSNQP